MVTRTDDRTRGQVILIGAIALAFIILGIVVVFNGVLYTETVSSGTSSQSASAADVTATEVEQSVGCALVILEDDGFSSEQDIEDEIDALDPPYPETTARSRPTIVGLAVDDIQADDLSNDITHVDVTVTYDSHDLSYERTQRIQPGDCPDGDL